MKTRGSRTAQIMFVVGMLASGLAQLGVAQVFQAQQAIKNTGGYQTDGQGTILDAHKYAPGSDICASINTTWTYAMAHVSSATIDARGFTGGVSCTISPIPSGARGRLLLGNVWISTAASIVVPAGVEVIGLGPNGPNGDGSSTSPVNTVVAATDNTFSGAVIKMGDSISPGAQFGVKIRSLGVDCMGGANCTGIENTIAGEGSIVEDVTINDAGLYGLHVTVGNPGTSHSATHSGPYRNITVQYFYDSITLLSKCGGCSASKTMGVQLDCAIAGAACPYDLAFDNITADATNIYGGTPTQTAIGFYTLGVPAVLTNSHIENYQVASVKIGTPGVPTYGVKIENLSFNSGGGVLGRVHTKSTIFG